MICLSFMADSVDPGEMSYCAAFHLGLHCLPNTHLGSRLAFSRVSFTFMKVYSLLFSDFQKRRKIYL